MQHNGGLLDSVHERGLPMRRSALLSSFALASLLGCSGEVQVDTTTMSGSAGSSSGGAGGTAGAPTGGAGTGGSLPSGAERPSCAGKDLTCAGQSCCAVSLVPGGTYNRLNDPAYPATVSDFYLDIFEVTVGRMRSFVEAYPGSKPKAGDGAHPKEPKSGWNEDVYLPDSQEKLRWALGTDPGADDKTPFLPWTDEPGPNENRPISNVTWQVAQAFCIWDGGRLPTEAEWNYAIAGGDEQRTYPWGEAPTKPEWAALNYNDPGGPYDMAGLDVGMLSGGATRWGHLDMNGGRMEMMLDANLADCCDISELPVPCDDCVVVAKNAEDGRVTRDASAFHLATATEASAESRQGYFWVNQVDIAVGFRCVYTPPAD